MTLRELSAADRNTWSFFRRCASEQAMGATGELFVLQAEVADCLFVDVGSPQLGPCTVMNSAGTRLSFRVFVFPDHEFTDVLDLFDANADGKLVFAEFLSFWHIATLPWAGVPNNLTGENLADVEQVKQRVGFAFIDSNKDGNIVWDEVFAYMEETLHEYSGLLQPGELADAVSA